MSTKELVTHLIREELRNKRLMHSLENLGFDCSSYTLNISHVILELAGLKNGNDELHSWYFTLVEKALEEITFWNLDEMLNKWSKRIYIELAKKGG